MFTRLLHCREQRRPIRAYAHAKAKQSIHCSTGPQSRTLVHCSCSGSFNLCTRSTCRHSCHLHYILSKRHYVDTQVKQYSDYSTCRPEHYLLGQTLTVRLVTIRFKTKNISSYQLITIEETISDVHRRASGVKISIKAQSFWQFRPRDYKTFLYSTQLSTKFSLLINVKMPTIVGILTFISMINTTSERLKPRHFLICRYLSFYEQLKFRAQLNCA